MLSNRGKVLYSIPYAEHKGFYVGNIVCIEKEQYL